MRRFQFLSLGLAFWYFSGAPIVGAADAETLASPDGKVEVTVRETHQGLVYSVRLDGTEVLVDSPLGLEFTTGRAIAPGTKIAAVTHGGANSKWQPVWGKRSEIVDHYQEMTLQLAEPTGGNSIDLVVRAYDDGVALRYLVPESWGAFVLKRDLTGFRFPTDATVWAANFGGFHSSQESEFVKQPVSKLRSDQVYGCPLLASIDDNVWAAFTEANLTDWAGMHLTRSAEHPQTIIAKLSPYPDEPEVAVKSTAPRQSPWRVIMLGRRAGDLIESDLICNLNDPPVGDFSWVKPGKCTWDPWWSGAYAPDVDFQVGMNTESMKYFVDLAPELGAIYQLVDDGWYGESFAPGARTTTWAANPNADLTKIVPAVDLPELINYADERGVQIVLWTQWQTVDKQMDEAFPEFEKWGVAGVKIDFMDRDDQEVVNFYHRVARKAAEHHLLVDFHGAYKPTGDSRTWPNLITREGVLGNEYNKWSARITPEHTVTIPFTRGLFGEMDFTPGGFRHSTVEKFEPQDSGPFVMGTRARQLAMFVVYESAFTVICDSPYNYRNSPAGVDFLKAVPTTWDDTRCLYGEPGDLVVVARRSGHEWFVGSMTDENARTLDVKLDFLGPGTYTLEAWSDADGGLDRVLHASRTVSRGDVVPVEMAAAGGHVMRITPQ